MHTYTVGITHEHTFIHTAKQRDAQAPSGACFIRTYAHMILLEGEEQVLPLLQNASG